jgi:hypothetical protein
MIHFSFSVNEIQQQILKQILKTRPFQIIGILKNFLGGFQQVFTFVL